VEYPGQEKYGPVWLCWLHTYSVIGPTHLCTMSSKIDRNNRLRGIPYDCSEDGLIVTVPKRRLDTFDQHLDVQQALGIVSEETSCTKGPPTTRTTMTYAYGVGHREGHRRKLRPAHPFPLRIPQMLRQLFEHVTGLCEW